MHRTSWFNASGAMILVTLAGCTVGPNYSRPKIDVPDRFSDSATAIAERNTMLAQWWTQLEDPVLDDLISRAIANNHDLKLAASRLRESRALLGVQESARFPSVDAAGGYNRSRSSENTNFSPPGDTSGTDQFEIGLDASWEIDIFGGIRRGVEAARADLEATIEDERGVLVSLVSEVARVYSEYRAFQQRLDVADRAIEAQQQTLNLTSSRLAAGLTGELQVAQSRVELAVRQSQRPGLVIGERTTLHRLGVLLGESPTSLSESLRERGGIPQADGVVAVGLPSDLLLRRPDLRSAERAVHAATARIGVAESDLYPKFSLTGGFGLQSKDLADLPEGNSRFWNIGPAARWNIFDAGRIRRRIDAASEREKQALINFEETVLVALEEVENALVTLDQERDRARFLREAVDAGNRAVTLSDERYRSGVGDFLDVLESQRQLYDNEDQLVQSSLSSTRAFIALYKALGGGWEPAGGQEVPTEQVPNQPGQAPASRTENMNAELPVGS